MIMTEILKRRSIRAYREKAIEREKLERILEAGRLAPTAKNTQGWRILVIDDPELKKRLIDASSPHQSFLYEAGAILVACGTNPGYVMRCGQPAYPIDLAIVLDHISLQAVAEGLGTCWIGSFQEQPAKEVLGIPPEVRIVELMSLGYPAEEPVPRPRKSAAELFSFNRW